MAHFDIAGKTLSRVHVGTILVKALDLVPRTVGRTQAQKANVRRKEFGHLHDGPGGIVTPGKNVEGGHNRLEVCIPDGLVNRLLLARYAFVGYNPQKHVVRLPLPSKHLRIGFLPPVPHARVGTRHTSYQQHLPAQQRIRNFEEYLLCIAVDGKQSLVSGHAFLDDLGIFLHLRLVFRLGGSLRGSGRRVCHTSGL